MTNESISAIDLLRNMGYTYENGEWKAPSPVKEPVLYVSPGQLAAHKDSPHEMAGNYLAARKTAAGKFTQPLYAQPIGETVKEQTTGKVLVPMRLTRAMARVIDNEGWQWEDLLAVANAVTEEQYDAIADNVLSKDEIREVFIKKGFTVKEGQEDLKDYVYEAARELEDLVLKQNAHDFPMQPIELVEGVVRFKENRMVRAVLANSQAHGLGLNELARGDYTKDEAMQFAQLIGYSVSGYGELPYASVSSVTKADVIAEDIMASQRFTVDQILTEVDATETGIAGHTVVSGHYFQIEKDERNLFYIIVKAPDGGTLYNGWPGARIKTLREAVEEALTGCGLLQL